MDNKNKINKSNKHVFKFVLTGGPCSGKTTAFQIVKDYLEKHNYHVYMVPEAATMLFINGVAFSDLDSDEGKYTMQQSVLSIQKHVENAFENVARSTGHRCVLLCDRGSMDGSAYIDRDEFVKIVRETGSDIPLIRDSQYDGVMHLVSAADGAESYYTLANNLARSEPKDFARHVDFANQHAWSGHPHHFIFDNSHPSFNAKLEALVSRIAGELGLPHERQESETSPPTISYTLEEFPSDDLFPPDCKAREQTLTYLYTSLPSNYSLPETDLTSRYSTLGLGTSIISSENIESIDNLNINHDTDHLIDKETGEIINRVVVARYVCKRIPVPLNRTMPPPATLSPPNLPPPEKEFPLSVYPDSNPVPTYEMTIIRKLENDVTNGKYYKVHMSIREEDYEYLIKTQKDPNKREVHQKRYYFINGRQPIVVIKNLDEWLLNKCSISSNQQLDEYSVLKSTYVSPAWLKVCTEGSTLTPIPSFLKIGDKIRSNSMEYTISIAAQFDSNNDSDKIDDIKNIEG